jgi:hypothetical protein
MMRTPLFNVAVTAGQAHQPQMHRLFVPVFLVLQDDSGDMGYPTSIPVRMELNFPALSHTGDHYIVVG